MTARRLTAQLVPGGEWSGRPFYARALRLRHVNPSSTVCFVFLEGATAFAIILALAELIPAWGIVLLPICIAAMVKINDVVAGAAVRAAATRTGGARRPLRPFRTIGRAAVPGGAAAADKVGRVYRSAPVDTVPAGPAGAAKGPAGTGGPAPAARAGATKRSVGTAGTATAGSVGTANGLAETGATAPTGPAGAANGLAGSASAGRAALGGAPDGLAGTADTAATGPAGVGNGFSGTGGTAAGDELCEDAFGDPETDPPQPGEGQRGAIPQARHATQAAALNAPPVDLHGGRGARTPTTRPADVFDTPAQRARHSANRRYR
ncbi:hypothetical protein [Asanoa siamensis]|uniref:Uncharacterized protein n=1 Tax=Asanoa siamensis TaxID=926357 RepID=A0ABQ4CLS5_9ACTN|nr:hypothetical protein Asi02nite_17430 [Asanoa siamensis]